MDRIERSIEIKALPEKVWEMFAFDKLSEWMDFESVKYTSEILTQSDRYRVGATALGTPKGGPPDNCHFEITESLEHKKFTYRLWEKVYRGKMALFITCILQPSEEGTKLTLVFVTDEIAWGILGKIIVELMARMSFKKDIDRSLEKLKTIQEK